MPERADGTKMSVTAEGYTENGSYPILAQTLAVMIFSSTSRTMPS